MQIYNNNSVRFNDHIGYRIFLIFLNQILIISITKSIKMDKKQGNKKKQQESEDDDIQIEQEAILVSWHSSNSSKRSNQEDLKSMKDQSELEYSKNQFHQNIKKKDESFEQDNDKLLQINQTIDFDDDLTSSIRQQPIKPRTFANIQRHKQNDENDKSNKKTNQVLKKINKSQVQIEFDEAQNQKLEQSSSSNNTFSNLNQKSRSSSQFNSKISEQSFGDFNEQKDSLIRQDNFSAFNQKQDQFKSVQNYYIDEGQDLMQPTAFSRLNNKKNSQNNKSQQIDIFGELIVPQKSTLNINYTKKSPIFETKQQHIDLLNMSLITQKKSDNKQRRQEHKKDNSLQKKYIQRETISDKSSQQVNLQESYYMKPDSVKQNQKIKKQLIKKEFNQVRIICKDFTYFIEYKEVTLTISSQLIKRIMEMFLQQNIMLPLFNQQILQAWKKQDKDQFNQFNLYVRQYFEFINRKYGQSFKRIVNKLSQLKKDRSVARISNQQEKKTYTQMFFKLFQKNSYSKPQMLKKTLQVKLECIQIINDVPFLQTSLKQKSQRTKQIQEQVKSLKRKICGLEILINFQKSQLYCNKKLEQKLQENIWKKRKDRLVRDRNWYITNIFNSILI